MNQPVETEVSDAAVNALFAVIYRLRDIKPLSEKQIVALQRATGRDAETVHEEELAIEGDEIYRLITRLQSGLDRWFSLGAEPDIALIGALVRQLRDVGQAELAEALLATWQLHFPHHAFAEDSGEDIDIELPLELPEPAPPSKPLGSPPYIRDFDSRRSVTNMSNGNSDRNGALAEINGSDVVDNWRMPPVILMALGGVPPTNISLVRNQGDSMVPTLLDGDVAVIDTRHTVPSPDGLYALKDPFGAAIIKRLAMMTNSESTIPIVQMMSDNPKYEPRRLQLDEVRILGRVVRKFGHVS